MSHRASTPLRPSTNPPPWTPCPTSYRRSRYDRGPPHTADRHAESAPSGNAEHPASSHSGAPERRSRTRSSQSNPSPSVRSHPAYRPACPYIRPAGIRPPQCSPHTPECRLRSKSSAPFGTRMRTTEQHKPKRENTYSLPCKNTTTPPKTQAAKRTANGKHVIAALYSRQILHTKALSCRIKAYDVHHHVFRTRHLPRNPRSHRGPGL
ncbi:hypothetical protein AC781_12045 [Akkermansia glycaniphila]|nr:hypothetical protein AC781_12045 [Akkermansia glycaniphila]